MKLSCGNRESFYWRRIPLEKSVWILLKDCIHQFIFSPCLCFLLYHKPGIWYPNEYRMNHLFPFTAFPVIFRGLILFFLSVRTTLVFRISHYQQKNILWNRKHIMRKTDNVNCVKNRIYECKPYFMTSEIRRVDSQFCSLTVLLSSLLAGFWSDLRDEYSNLKKPYSLYCITGINMYMDLVIWFTLMGFCGFWWICHGLKFLHYTNSNRTLLPPFYFESFVGEYVLYASFAAKFILL